MVDGLAATTAQQQDVFVRLFEKGTKSTVAHREDTKGEDEAERRSSLLNGDAPIKRGSVFDRLTDTSRYPLSHRNRYEPEPAPKIVRQRSRRETTTPISTTTPSSFAHTGPNTPTKHLGHNTPTPTHIATTTTAFLTATTPLPDTIPIIPPANAPKASYATITSGGAKNSFPSSTATPRTPPFTTHTLAPPSPPSTTLSAPTTVHEQQNIFERAEKPYVSSPRNSSTTVITIPSPRKSTSCNERPGRENENSLSSHKDSPRLAWDTLVGRESEVNVDGVLGEVDTLPNGFKKSEKDGRIWSVTLHVKQRQSSLMIDF
jgi:hypothetical protein